MDILESHCVHVCPVFPKINYSFFTLVKATVVKATVVKAAAVEFLPHYICFILYFYTIA